MQDQLRNLAIRWRWLTSEVNSIKDSAIFKLDRTGVLRLGSSAALDVEQARGIIVVVELSLRDMPNWICDKELQIMSDTSLPECNVEEEELVRSWKGSLDINKPDELLAHSRLVENRMQMLRLCVASILSAQWTHPTYSKSRMESYVQPRMDQLPSNSAKLELQNPSEANRPMEFSSLSDSRLVDFDVLPGSHSELIAKVRLQESDQRHPGTELSGPVLGQELCQERSSDLAVHIERTDSQRFGSTSRVPQIRSGDGAAAHRSFASLEACSPEADIIMPSNLGTPQHPEHRSEFEPGAQDKDVLHSHDNGSLLLQLSQDLIEIGNTQIDADVHNQTFAQNNKAHHVSNTCALSPFRAMHSNLNELAQPFVRGKSYSVQPDTEPARNVMEHTRTTQEQDHSNPEFLFTDATPFSDERLLDIDAEENKLSMNSSPAPFTATTSVNQHETFGLDETPRALITTQDDAIIGSSIEHPTHLAERLVEISAHETKSSQLSSGTSGELSSSTSDHLFNFETRSDRSSRSDSMDWPDRVSLTSVDNVFGQDTPVSDVSKSCPVFPITASENKDLSTPVTVNTARDSGEDLRYTFTQCERNNRRHLEFMPSANPLPTSSKKCFYFNPKQGLKSCPRGRFCHFLHTSSGSQLTGRINQSENNIYVKLSETQALRDPDSKLIWPVFALNEVFEEVKPKEINQGLNTRLSEVPDLSLSEFGGSLVQLESSADERLSGPSTCSASSSSKIRVEVAQLSPVISGFTTHLGRSEIVLQDLIRLHRKSESIKTSVRQMQELKLLTIAVKKKLCSSESRYTSARVSSIESDAQDSELDGSYVRLINGRIICYDSDFDAPEFLSFWSDFRHTARIESRIS